jgi:hypothetical protein
MKGNQQGQANLTAILLFVGLIVAGIWGWKRLSPDTQEYLVDHAFPIAALGIAAIGLIWAAVRKVRAWHRQRQRRERLIARFEREPAPDKQRDLAFLLVELNEYHLEGLERVAAPLADVLMATVKTALGDKQHRTRGMAASYLGVLQDKRAIPLLLKALEDDHAYVRASAALGLGRMRAAEAKEKLAEMATEDWDQTVRSRAREALERIA